MNKIILIGDSQVGKSTFAHLACHHPVPLNMYSSVENESYFYRGAERTTELVVVHSAVSNRELSSTAKQCEAVIVLYNNDIYSAKRWLRRLANGIDGVYKIPILICKHKSAFSHGRHDRRLNETLTQYVYAEHTYTSKNRAIGIQDCMNRIITRVRRDLPSPLSSYVHDESDIRAIHEQCHKLAR